MKKALGTETESVDSKEKLSLGMETAVTCEQLTQGSKGTLTMMKTNLTSGELPYELDMVVPLLPVC